MRFTFIISCLSLLGFLQFGASFTALAGLRIRNDTLTDENATFYYTLSNSIMISRVDTGLSNFHHYIPGAKRNLQRILLTGNTGGAAYPLIFEPAGAPGFQTGLKQYDIYRAIPDSIRLYRSLKPYSELLMVIGTQKELMFNALHGQQIKPSWYLGFDFQRINSEGIYQRQHAITNALSLVTEYRPEVKRYYNRMAFVYNKQKHLENGGTRRVDFFDDSLVIRKSLVGVQLSQAESQLKENSIIIEQGFKLNKMPASPDTVEEFHKYSSMVFHRFKHQYFQEAYYDYAPDSGYYRHFYSDVDTLFSGINVRLFSNALGYSYQLNRNDAHYPTLYGSLIFRHQFGKLENGAYSRWLQNYRISVQTAGWAGKQRQFHWDFYGDYFVGGYNAKDYRFRFSLKWHKNHNTILLTGGIQQERAPYIAEKWYAEKWLWQNAFAKVATWATTSGYQNNRIQLALKGSYYLLQNYIYWGEDGFPVQHSQGIHMGVFTLKKTFSYRNWHLDNLAVVQLSSDETIMPYPVLMLQHTPYYEGLLFQEKLLFRAGFDVYYRTAYHAPYYFPLTGQFILQSQEAVRYYPVVDVFLNLKVSRVRIFFLFTHLTQGIFEKGYFDLWRYPHPDRAFKGGVSWRFFD